MVAELGDHGLLDFPVQGDISPERVAQLQSVVDVEFCVLLDELRVGDLVQRYPLDRKHLGELREGTPDSDHEFEPLREAGHMPRKERRNGIPIVRLVEFRIAEPVDQDQTVVHWDLSLSLEDAEGFQDPLDEGVAGVLGAFSQGEVGLELGFTEQHLPVDAEALGELGC